MKRIHILLIVLALTALAILFLLQLRRPVIAVIQIVKGKVTVAQRVVQFGESVRIRLAPAFDTAGVRYPPPHMTFVGLKDERQLEVWAPRDSGSMALVKTYPILGSSGTLGPSPKLQEGDKQVPEGLYQKILMSGIISGRVSQPQ